MSRQVAVGMSLLSMAPGQASGTVTAVRELLVRFAARPEDVSIALLAHAAAARRIEDLDLPGIGLGLAAGYPGAATGKRRTAAMTLAAARTRLWSALGEAVDVMHFPLTLPVPRPHGPFVITLHDVQHHDRPELFSRAEHAWRRVMYDATARRAAIVVTDSEHARRRIVERVGVPPERVVSIPLAVDHARFCPERAPGEERTLDRFGLAERFLLYPAGLWPHKNHDRLLAALALVEDEELHLVLTGSTFGRWPALQAAAQRHGVGDRVHHLGSVEDAVLPALYRRATALAFPSLHEGFGVPPLEAMACGCPVASSRAAALEEVCGSATAVLDPVDVAGMATVLEAVVHDHDLRRRLRADGIEQAARYTWDAAADAYVEVYRRAAGIA